MSQDFVAFAFGPFLLMPSQRTLLHHGQPVRLGSRAFDILCILVEHAGEVVGKDQLFARAWPRSVVDEGGLRVHVAALRKALGETPAGLRYITNIPSRGYCFVAPVSMAASSTGPHAPLPSRTDSRPQPLHGTRLIGRDEAILALVRALPQRRFATLVGPGGLGKTTVALAAAAELEAHYADGARFVDLSCVVEGPQLPICVATALGVSHPSNDVGASVLDWASTRSLLLVLDNCEHLAEAAALFAEAWMANGNSHLLTTSREPLRARNEWLVRLPPLASPPDYETLDWDAAMRFPAFELFVERASACAPGIQPGPDHIAHIARICRRLDGIPLAIELVAAQIGFYGLEGLEAILDGRLSLTALGYRTVQPRHQSLRGTLDWSWDLLPSLEQRLLARLSVFRDRFHLHAAMTVAGERAAVATHALASLVSKSLVVTEPDEDSDSSVSYRLLETTRSYAAEKLQLGSDAEEVRRAHAQHCLQLLQRSALERGTIDAGGWRRRHLRHLHDVRAALGWALGPQGDGELGARLVVNASVYFSCIGALAEHMGWLEQAQARLPPRCLDSDLEMLICLELGQAEMVLRGACAQSRHSLKRAAQIAHRLGMTDYRLTALRAECSGLLLQGDHAQAEQAALRHGEIADKLLDPRAVQSAHRMRGLCQHLQGRHRQALEEIRKALHPQAPLPRQMFANISQPDERTAALVHLARVLWVTGDSDLARRAARDALDHARATGHGLSELYALVFAACPVALWNQDLDAAAELIEQLEGGASRLAFGFWQTWPTLYRQAMNRLTKPDAATKQVLDGLHLSHAAQADMLASFHVSLIGDLAHARALSNLDLWTAPEVLRGLGERASMAGEHETALGLLQESLALARRQGAHAWALRSAISLARLYPHAPDSAILSEVLTQCLRGGANGDTDRAQALLRSMAGVPLPAR